MKELSLHILDIMQNSISAGATLVELLVNEDAADDVLSFEIKDNGRGMSGEFLEKVTDPFTTTRTTRKVGLGIPLLKAACEAAGGDVIISSAQGVGTTIKATFGYSHIDRQPLGDMAETVHGIIISYEEIDFLYTHMKNGKTFALDTRDIKSALGGVSLKTPEALLWLLEYLREGEEDLEKNV